MSFRQVIQREAERQELSGYALGKLSGIPIRTVQAYLSGSIDLASRRVEALAAALGLELRKVTRTRTKRVER